MNRKHITSAEKCNTKYNSYQYVLDLLVTVGNYYLTITEQAMKYSEGNNIWRANLLAPLFASPFEAPILSVEVNEALAAKDGAINR